MSKPDISVVIPSRNEKFLYPTVKDVLNKARGAIEVLIHLDGYRPPKEEIVKDDRVIYIYSGDVCGMRAGINKCVAISNGAYIVKLDAHHIVSPGFDVELLKADAPNRVQVMRRRRLDADNWCEEITHKPAVDYEFLSCPESKDADKDFGGRGLNGRIWTERILERINIPIDENMSFQGSNWGMSKDYFHWLGLMDDEKFSTFWCEAQEVGCGAWLSSRNGMGTVVVNKNADAIHLHKGRKHGRMYTLQEKWLKIGRDATMTMFKGEKLFKNQDRPLSWLIERFWPVPTWSEKSLNDLKERERKFGWNV